MRNTKWRSVSSYFWLHVVMTRLKLTGLISIFHKFIGTRADTQLSLAIIEWLGEYKIKRNPSIFKIFSSTFENNLFLMIKDFFQITVTECFR